MTNPQKIGSVVKYTVTGQDPQQGRWETSRRYNEFFILHNVLNERWPGCFIPCIPEKQILGDKEDGFIEERRSLLNRFILECSKFEFIINSDEFKIFALQKAGEIGPALENMPKQRPTQILDRYRLCFKIDENLDNSDLARFREKINSFNQFLVKAVVAMQVSLPQLIAMSLPIERQTHAYECRHPVPEVLRPLRERLPPVHAV